MVLNMQNVKAWHLASSLLFFLGTVSPVATYLIYEYGMNGKMNRMVMRTVEACSWSFLTAHVLPEIVIDLSPFPGPGRRSARMRYGTGPCVNVVHSLIFAAACMLQGAYNVHEWSDDAAQNNVNAEEERPFYYINLIAGHVWALSGIITIISVGFRCFCCGRSSAHKTTLMQMASDTYILSTFVLCVAGYEQLFPVNADGQSSNLDLYINMSVRGVWALLGIFYLLSDIISSCMEGAAPRRSPRHHHHAGSSKQVGDFASTASTRLTEEAV
jgi:hypothetical protein